MTDSLTQTQQEIEKMVISSVIDDSANYEQVKNIICPEMFMDSKYRGIARYLQKRHKEGQPWDTIIIADSVEPEKAGDVYNLAAEAPLNMIFHEHFKLLHIRYFWRKMMEEMADPHNADVSIVKKFVEDYQAIGNDARERGFMDISKNAAEKAANAGLVGIDHPTIFMQLNRMVQGFHKKQIVLIVGATGHSKSLFAWNMLLQPLLDGKKVIVYDYEMPEESLIIRLVAMHYKIPLDWLQHGSHHTDGEKITDDERAEGVAALGAMVDRVKSNLIIKTLSKIDQMEADFQKEKPDIILIDTIQAFCKKHQKPNGVNNADHITDICSRINRLAKEYDVAILETAQVNRATDGAMPSEANIKESSGIADNAAVIIGVRDLEKVSQKEEDKDVFDIGVGKNRHGALGKLRYKMNKAIALIAEYKPPLSIEQERKEKI